MSSKNNRNFVFKHFWKINKPKVHKNKKKSETKHKSRLYRDFSFIALKKLANEK